MTQLLINHFQVSQTYTLNTTSATLISPRPARMISTGVSGTKAQSLVTAITAAGGSSATSIVGSGWTANEYVGKVATCISGVNVGQSRFITASGTTTLTLSPGFASSTTGDVFDVREPGTDLPVLNSMELQQTSATAGSVFLESVSYSTGSAVTTTLASYTSVAAAAGSLSNGDMERVGGIGGDIRIRTTASLTGSISLDGYYESSIGDTQTIGE